MNAGSFKKQFLPYANKLYSIAFGILKNDEDAKDAVQETFTKIWTKRETINPTNNEAFCVVMLKNTCIDNLRKRKINEDVSKLEKIESKQSANKEIENNDSWEIMKKLISKLPEKQQTVLEMWHINEYSMEEIEEKTGLNSINIRTLLSRARKTLREKFQKLENYELR